MTLSTTRDQGVALDALRRKLGKGDFEVNEVEAVSIIVRSPDIDMTPMEASGAIDGLVENCQLSRDKKKATIIFKAP